jgi:hypothetical protein
MVINLLSITGKRNLKRFTVYFGGIISVIVTVLTIACMGNRSPVVRDEWNRSHLERTFRSVMFTYTR